MHGNSNMKFTQIYSYGWTDMTELTDTFCLWTHIQVIKVCFLFIVINVWEVKCLVYIVNSFNDDETQNDDDDSDDDNDNNNNNNNNNNQENGLTVKWYNSVHNYRPYQIPSWPYPWITLVDLKVSKICCVKHEFFYYNNNIKMIFFYLSTN